MLNVNNFGLHEIARPVVGLAPLSLTAGGTTNCAVISLKGISKLSVLILNPAGSTLTITAEQCTAVAGTGNKAFTGFSEVWQGNNTTDSMARVTLANAGTHTLTASKYCTIDIDPSTLDIDNSFDCLRININVAAGTSIPAVFYFCKGGRYEGAGVNISAVAD